MGDILINKSTFILLLVLVGALSLVIGLITPRGVEMVTEEKIVVVNKCINPCGECMNDVMGMKEMLERVDKEAQKTSWCLQDNNWRLTECQK